MRSTAFVSSQAHITPGVLHIDSNTSAAEVSLSLAEQPSCTVTVQVTVPNAWDGNPITDVFPSTLTFDPATWNTTQSVGLFPRLACEGDYYLNFNLE